MLNSSISSKQHKNIGVAVIWNSLDQILIDKRLPVGLLGGFWEFPGGKLEAGETIEACIKREIQEELGIEIEVKEHFLTIDYDYIKYVVTLYVYHCEYLGGEPQTIECAEVRWVNIEEIDQFSFPPANEQIIAKIKLFSRSPITGKSGEGPPEGSRAIAL